MDLVEWRPVVGYEGLYEVSSDGRVRSTRRQGSRGGERKQKLDRWGYFYVDLFAANRGRTFKTHVLVAAAFLGPRPDGLQVRHLDGDSKNCAASNLAYGTPSQNMYDAVRHGTHATASRSRCRRGHPYDEQNTRIYRGRRYCRRCDGWQGSPKDSAGSATSGGLT